MNLAGVPPPEFPVCQQLSWDTDIPSLPGVYFIWLDDVVIYVGRSKNVRKRIATHNIYKKCLWLPLSVSVIHVYGREQKMVEHRFIGQLEPVLNDGGEIGDLHAAFVKAMGDGTIKTKTAEDSVKIWLLAKRDWQYRETKIHPKYEVSDGNESAVVEKQIKHYCRGTLSPKGILIRKIQNETNETELK